MTLAMMILEDAENKWLLFVRWLNYHLDILSYSKLSVLNLQEEFYFLVLQDQEKHL